MLEDKFIYNEVNFRNINKSNVCRKFAREIFANIREATVSEQKIFNIILIIYLSQQDLNFMKE